MIHGLNDLKNCTKEKLNYLLMIEEACLQEKILDELLFENWILKKITEILKVSLNLNDELWIIECLFKKPSEYEIKDILFLISKQLSSVRKKKKNFFLNHFRNVKII